MPQARRGRGFKSSSRPSYFHRERGPARTIATVQSGMKKALQDISIAPIRAVAELALQAFAEKYGAKYARAVDCLNKDRDDLLAPVRDQPEDSGQVEGQIVGF